MQALRDVGVLVLADAKRGDIGSTMAAYADAWAGDSPLAADAVTASPYLGFGSLQPLLDTAERQWPRCLCPRRDIQSRRAQAFSVPTPAGELSRSRLSMPRPRSTATARPSPGAIGVVVGATLAEPPDVSALGGPVLVPGVGAQGGRPEALGGLGGARPGQLLPAVSRDVLRAGPDVAAVRAAAEKFRDAVAYLG